MDSTLKVAPHTPAHKRRTKLVSGLTGQICKYNIILCYVFFITFFFYWTKRWLLFLSWGGLSSWWGDWCDCQQLYSGKIFLIIVFFLFQYFRPLWFVRKWMEKWLPLDSPRSILAIKSYSRKSRKMEREFRRSSMYLVEVLPRVEMPTHHHRMELIFSYVN